MEPDIMSSHSDSSLALDGDGDGGVGSEEDEFGEFSLPMVCSPLGLADATVSPSFARQTSPTLKPATHQPNSSINHPVEQNQHTSALKLGSDRCHLDVESFSACIVNSPAEETGFADFTLFTEQAGHPWCCGFTEQWDRRAEEEDNSSGEHTGILRHNAVVESDLKTQHSCRKGVCINVKHCEKRNAVHTQPSQGHHQPEARVCETLTEDEPASADQISYCDGFSFERASEEMEPQSPPSLASQGNESINCNHCTTQETSATSSQSHLTNTQNNQIAHLADGLCEHHREQEPVQTADTRIQSLGNLPPSDSFADFCSAPMQDDEEGPWVDFKHRSAPVEGKTWTWFREPFSSLDTEMDNKEQDGATEGNSCQASLSCRVQLLLQSSFPVIPVPAVDGEEELLSLNALLQIQDLPESEELIQELSHALRIQRLMLGPHQDVYRSLGLQFQWGGSHANTSLLSCLGVDVRNIVFMGTRKQPVTVSTSVSGLGMLEPSKDPLPVVYSPQPKGARCTLDPSAHSVQALPSRQLNWSTRSLSSSQEGMSPCRAPHM